MATIHKWTLGGPDPLDGISVYPRADPVPHWHFVSYGMSELYEKTSSNADESGWGFEFTFRLVRDPPRSSRRSGRRTCCKISPGTCSIPATGSSRATT
ncbi:suppressor of fused domain protein [Actinomadura sp. LOL_016]|uniref:suppressor of fused domain protein n=1 Tax=unclassified Actinomadura TaxID=2626254 RepID=UPI003A80F813